MENLTVDVTVTIPGQIVESTVKGIMENYPEADRGNSLYCIGWDYDNWKFTFVDGEEDKEYELTKEKLLTAFPLILTDKWPKGLTTPPASDSAERWDDWLCECDAGDFDAFVQLACFGEVIYG